MKHVQLSRNYGLLLGWLLVEFWTWPNGDPTGVTRAQHIADEAAPEWSNSPE